MNRFQNFTKPLMWFVALFLTAFVAGCGGGNDTAVVPASSAKAMTAYTLGGATGTINETMKTISVTKPFGTNVTALVATFTHTGASIAVSSVAQTSGTTPNNFTNPVAYKVTAANGTWATYTVLVTVAANTAKAITAYSLNGSTGTISEVAKTIAVTMPYGTAVSGLVATFTTTGASVTVSGVAQTSGTTPNDFTTSKAYLVTAADATTATYTVTVTVALNSAKAITAYSLNGITGTISEVPKTIAVTMPYGTAVSGLVATFTTTGASVKVSGVVQTSGSTANNFASSVPYTVTAADSSTAIYTVTVTVNAVSNPTAPTLGEAGRYVILASQAVTTTGVTAITNGDIGIMDIPRSGMAGFTPSGPAGDFTELTGSTWAGMLSTSYASNDSNPAPFPAPLAYAVPHAGYATSLAMIDQSRTDLGVAYTFLAADPNPGAPTQVCPTELGGLTLTPGVYKTAANVLITTGTLNLDAQGDPNAVWIFSIDGTLATGAPGGSIAFVGGVGQAKNVFWRVAGVTTIGAGTTFYGSVFSNVNVDVLSGANITGSLYSNTAAVTLIADTVTKAP